jgi:Methylamine utilisation protein MauE
VTPVLTLAPRLILAAVFATAALAKLSDRGGGPDALRAFGVPARLARPFAVVLPVAELAVAATLLVPAIARWGALAALALLLGFCVAIVLSLRAGRTAPCHCFGALHSRPVSALTLVRTAGLAVLAGALVALGHPAAEAMPRLTTPSAATALALAIALALVAMLAAGAALFAALTAQNGRLMLRLEALEHHLGEPAASGPGALPSGSAAPPFATRDADGRRVSLGGLLAGGRSAVLVFSDPDCGPCRALRPELTVWQRAHADRVTVAVLERRPEIAHAYGARATPAAIAIAPDATIASVLALGAPAIAALVASAARTADDGRDADAALTVTTPRTTDAAAMR